VEIKDVKNKLKRVEEELEEYHKDKEFFEEVLESRTEFINTNQSDDLEEQKVFLTQ